LQIKSESIPSTDEIFGITILVLFIEVVVMIMLFYCVSDEFKFLNL